MARYSFRSVLRYAGSITQYLPAAILGVSMLGCGIEMEAAAPAVPPSTLVSYLVPEFKTYNLSTVKPYDTVTLKISGVSAAGDTLNLPVSFAYDTQYVAVTPDGILKAKAQVGSTPVVVSMTSHGATRYDTVQVSVIGTSPRHLARVALELEPGDSAKLSLLYDARPPRKDLRLIRVDSNNAPVESVLVFIQSSSATVVRAVQSGNSVSVLPGGSPGRSVVRASTFAYGLRFRDSLEFTIGWPLISYAFIEEGYITGQAEPGLRLGGSKIIVGVGGCVVFRNRSTELATDIVFDDPSNVLPADSAAPVVRSYCQNNGNYGVSFEGSGNGGNIQPFHQVMLVDFPTFVDISSAYRARAFTRPGVFTYRSSRYDFVGTIIVCDEQNDSTCAPESYQWGIPQK